MNKYELDILAANGCMLPGCTHEHADEHEIYFHANCHISTPLIYFVHENGIRFECAKCNKFICDVESTDIRIKECCQEGLVSPSYKLNSGIVKLTCYRCKQVIGEAFL